MYRVIKQAVCLLFVSFAFIDNIKCDVPPTTAMCRLTVKPGTFGSSQYNIDMGDHRAVYKDFKQINETETLKLIRTADQVSISVVGQGVYSSKGKKSFLYNVLSHGKFRRLYFQNIGMSESLINLFTDLSPIKHFETLAIVNCSTSKNFDATEYFDKIVAVYLRNVRAQNVLKYIQQLQCIEILIDRGIYYGLTEYDNQLYVGHIVNNAAVVQTVHIAVQSVEDFQYFSRFLRVFKPILLIEGYVRFTNLNDERVKYQLSYTIDEKGKRNYERHLQTTSMDILNTVLNEDKPEHFLIIDSLNVTFKDLNLKNRHDFAATIRKHTELKRLGIRTTSSLLLPFWAREFDIISHIPNITLGEIGKDDSQFFLKKSIEGSVASLSLFLMNTPEYQLFDLNEFIAAIDRHDHLQRVEIKTTPGQSMAIWPRVYNSIAHIPHITLTEVGEGYSQDIIQKSTDGNMPSLSLFLMDTTEYQQFDLDKFLPEVDSQIHLQRVVIKTPYGQSAAIWTRLFNLINHISYVTLSEVGKDYSQKIIEMSASALSMNVTNGQIYVLFDDLRNVTFEHHGPYIAATHQYYSHWLASSTNLIYLSVLDDNYSILAKALDVVVNTNPLAWTHVKHVTASISFLDKYSLMNLMNPEWFRSLEFFKFYTKDEAEAMSVFEWFRSNPIWNEHLNRIGNEVSSNKYQPQRYGQEL